MGKLKIIHELFVRNLVTKSRLTKNRAVADPISRPNKMLNTINLPIVFITLIFFLFNNHDNCNDHPNNIYEHGGVCLMVISVNYKK